MKNTNKKWWSFASAKLQAKSPRLLAIIAIVAIIGIGFTACGGDENTGGTHEHSWSAEWSSNATQHWKECTGAGCDAKTEIANHQYVYTVTSTSYPAQSIQTCSCGETTGTARNTIIGDRGPASGIIFYVASTGFTVQGYTGTTGSFTEYNAYYLEVSPANEDYIQWGAYETLIADVTTFTTYPPTATELIIGNGRKDTQIIVNHLATTEETGRAAQVCASKTVTVGGTVFNDWFMPSLGELNEIYKAKGQTGIPIETGWFWSSSQRDDVSAWAQLFSDGFQSRSIKTISYPVRAIRAF